MTRAAILKFVGYACVGAAGTAVQYVVLAVLVSVHAWGAVMASCLGAIAGAMVNYSLNYRFTFRATGMHRRSAPRFAVVAGVSILLNSTLMTVFTHRLDFAWLPAQLVTTGCVLVLTYVASSRWTFRTHRI
jgi:putative flippase GtrA